MLFNSYTYIIIFLPTVAIVYFGLTRYHLLLAGKSWLILASLFFYSYWTPIYLPLLMASILVNYGLGTTISSMQNINENNAFAISKKKILAFGILLNLGLLGYFKYAGFFMVNVNIITGSNFNLPNLILPLAISFFTFQQIAYLVDSYKVEVKEYNFLNYCLFVSFFPQLIAGPIVHHKEMMPQFGRLRNQILNWRNISIGLTLISIGLFKKVLVADTLSVWAIRGFDETAALAFLDAWAISLCYTFQIYYDFSGYTDIAIGSGYLFNIKLPTNFNSPYKALNIQDFWRRWHMTLSRWFRDYLYIPLGGNRKGRERTYFNLFVIFFIGGLWHGAGWTFLAWGAMHGAASVIHRWWQKLGFKLPGFVAWFLTFFFIHCTWVFFRAKTFGDAAKVFKGMFGFGGFIFPGWLSNTMGGMKKYGIVFGDSLGNIQGDGRIFLLIALFGLTAFFAKNSMEIKKSFKPNLYWAAFIATTTATSIFFLSRVSEFIYFQF